MMVVTKKEKANGSHVSLLSMMHMHAFRKHIQEQMKREIKNIEVIHPTVP